MSISEISIRRPVFAWMLMASLIVFGAISFNRMGVSLLPDVDFPVISVNLGLLGASPEVMETDVVDVVENSLSTIQGVKLITSTSRKGSASVTIQLDLDRNVDLAMQDVQAKISESLRKLPKEIDPPTISKTNPDDSPIMWITIESDQHSLRELMQYTRDHLQQHFATTPDVGDIFFGGYVDPNLRVWVSSKELSKYQLTVNDVITTVQNEHNEVPGGWIEEGQKEYTIRTLGEATSLAEFEKLPIISRGGAPNFLPIPLGRVAKIEEGLADIRRISRGMGKPAVGLGIRKQRGANSVQVAKDVREKIGLLSKSLPEGMKLAVNFDSTRFIEESVHELNFTLVLSALLTSLVCWIFLGSWSSTLNVLLSIPTSIVGTFIVLYFSGFTLNTFTLLGLSLAIGIVVDDAIMVLENIIRYREQGLSREQSALIGSKEITFAALAATLSIVSIFLPVTFMKGIIGKYFFQFGVTMTAAVLLSLLEALTLTPMRCAQFLEAGERTTRIGKVFEWGLHQTKLFYEKTLATVIHRPWTTIALSLVFFALSLGSIRLLKKEFAPAEDQGRFMLRAQTPIGSNIAFTDSKFKEIENYLSKRTDLERFYASVGGFGGGDVNSGIVFITLKPKGKRGLDPTLKREPTQQDLMNLFRTDLNKISDLKVTVQDLSMRGMGAGRGFPFEITIQGPDWNQLGKLSQELIDKMNASGFVTDLDSDYLVGMPELQVVPDRDKAAKHGVSLGAIGQTVSALMGGVIVGQYNVGGHRDDIRLKIQDEGGDRIERIKRLTIRNNRGELIPLSAVVNIEESPSLLSVARRNRQRAVTIYGNISKGKSQQEALDEALALSKTSFPEGYQIQATGSAEDMKETFQGLVFALGLGLIVAYMILASQFNSYIDPFSVLIALPFSISGALLALLLTGQSINMYSMIGIVLLMGIVKKNSILLVDFTNHVRSQKGGDVKAALLEACPIRLRPILMTSIATIAGAIPAALAFGPGAESRVPMAITVIGGVLVSTVLTLYVVPCVYQLLSRLEKKTYGATPESLLPAPKLQDGQ
jgi:HAE1 family hydrophobic/amphiphilic exporter-1